ncbi:hypothetical protein DL96DRAFT_1597337 [Flagelloscypha sp. PMI_526]|nr:hypothetical protein DL96DRAFT_1597337 [Flagelloscypha sp. PMI_526]
MAKQGSYALLDDTHPRLQYSGQWAFSVGETDTIGKSTGLAYQRTLHKASTSGASVQVTFEGTGFEFTGTANATKQENAPLYTCRIDGIPVDGGWAQGKENRISFCEKTGLPGGSHTASLTLDTPSPVGAPLLFDYVTYEPLQNAPLNDTPEQVFRGDPRINFAAEWESYSGDSSDITVTTTAQNADLKFTFNGVSAIMYGIIMANDTFDQGQASYSLDKGAEVTFVVPAANKTITETHYDYPYFNLSNLTPGTHELVVKDLTERNSPLTFGYFEITNTPSNSSAQTSGSSGAQPSNSAGSGSHSWPFYWRYRRDCSCWRCALIFIIRRRRRPRFDLDEKPDDQDENANRIADSNVNPGSPGSSGLSPLGHQALGNSAELLSSPGNSSGKHSRLSSNAQSSNTQSSDMHIENPDPTSPVTYVVHHDSGLRMDLNAPPERQSVIVDVPPLYAER